MRISFYAGAVSALFFIGCAHAAKPLDASQPHPELRWTALKLSSPVVLRLGEQKGSRELTTYASQSSSDTFENGEIRQHQDENVSFDARTEVLDSNEKTFTQQIRIDHKTGVVDLHQMAMPDLGETLSMSLSRDGKVLAAGGYPQNSIFYVPQISLPAAAVQVGDTWEMQAAWVSLDGEYPFSMSMISIFKGVYACGPVAKPDQCADIELSGQIAVSADEMPVIGFKNEWRGRLLFAIGAGEVVWSTVESNETYSAETLSRKVKTVLETKLVEPAGLLPANIAGFYPEPEAEANPAH